MTVSLGLDSLFKCYCITLRGWGGGGGEQVNIRIGVETYKMCTFPLRLVVISIFMQQRYFLFRILAPQSAAMLALSLPTKSRKRLAYDVTTTYTTHADLAHEATYLHRMSDTRYQRLRTFSRLLNVDFLTKKTVNHPIRIAGRLCFITAECLTHLNVMRKLFASLFVSCNFIENQSPHTRTHTLTHTHAHTHTHICLSLIHI